VKRVLDKIVDVKRDELHALWLGLSLWLGRRQVGLARARKNRSDSGIATYAW
jgi:hypothetical protein